MEKSAVLLKIDALEENLSEKEKMLLIILKRTTCILSGTQL